VVITQPLAVIKGDLAAITAQLEQWRGVEQDPPVWLDSLKLTRCTDFALPVSSKLSGSGEPL
jgi:hypothetical protein